MFNEQQRDFVKQLYLSNKKEYPYYIAFSNSNVTQYNQDNYNFYVLLSDKPIIANNRYNYTIDSNANYLYYGVRSNNASYNYYSERVVNLSLQSHNLSINNYEFVYTNAEFETVALQPNLIDTNYVTQDSFNGVCIAVLVVLLSCVVFRFLGGR